MKNLFAAGLLSLSVSCSSPPNSMADLVIKDVSVFNSMTGEVSENQSVFITDGLIRQISPMHVSDTATTIIEGQDRLLVPGFIETHAHFTHQFSDQRVLIDTDRDRLAQVYLPYGVTTVADMGQPADWVPTLARWEDTPRPDSPNIVLIAGGISTQHEWDTSPPAHHDMVESAEEAAQTVRQFASDGATRIKLYWKLTPDHMAGAMDAIRDGKLRTYAHVDNGYSSIDEAMSLGVQHFEHAFTTYRSLIDGDDLIPRINEAFPFEGHDSLDEWTASLSLFHDQIEKDPDLRAQYNQLLERMAATDATLSTALNILASAVGRSDSPSFFEPLPPRDIPNIRPDFIPENVASDAFDTVLQHLRRAHETGVTLRIGTDAANGGDAFIEELSLLAEAGFPIADILQIATRNGANALGLEDVSGRIDVGRAADLVLFEDNPFTDPDNLKSPLTVFKDGVIFEPVDRSEPVHAVEFGLHIHDAFDRGDFEQAALLIEHMSRVLNGENRADYVNEDSLIMSAFNHAKDEDYTPTLPGLKLVTALFPDSASSLANYAQVLAVTGQAEAALPIMERAAELAPDNAVIANLVTQLRDTASVDE